MNGTRRQAVRQRWLQAGGLSLALLAAAIGSPQVGSSASQPVAPPAEFKKGAAAFNANCARCHGERGVGTPQGPPLVHKIYEPNHHGDAAFQRAAAMGVRAHHWQFGDMPKVSTVTPADVDEIIQYVRWLQRQAGIN
ncbi:MAG: cytochrome c [Phycisphaerales bacterium]|nr:cytochrome c [Phycisphaerales bacterium]